MIVMQHGSSVKLYIEQELRLRGGTINLQLTALIL